MTVTKEYIAALKRASGQSDLSLSELTELYIALKNPKAKVVKIYNQIFVSFTKAPNVQFKLTNTTDLKKLSFMKKKEIIEPSKDEMKFTSFLIQEFLQGKRIIDKIKRFLKTILPTALLDLFIIIFADGKSLHDVFGALLASITIIVAIFSLFILNQEAFQLKKMDLFKNGKLGYYFSIDKNYVILGLSSIYFSLLGVIIPLEDKKIHELLNNTSVKLMLLLINLSFICIYLTLRGLVEFYLPRPAKFTLGDLKDEYLRSSMY